MIPPGATGFVGAVLGYATKIRNAFSLVAFVCGLAALITYRRVLPGEEKGMLILIGGAICFLVFGQLTRLVPSIPPEKRASFVFSLFVTFCVFLATLAVLYVVWVPSSSSADTAKPNDVEIKTTLKSAKYDQEGCAQANVYTFEVVATNHRKQPVTASLAVRPEPDDAIIIKHEAKQSAATRSVKPRTVPSSFDDEQYIVGLDILLSGMMPGATHTETIAVCDKNRVTLNVTPSILE